MNADIFVKKGQTLTIDPGVRVEFQGRYRLRLFGGLKAKGRANAPIVFTTTAQDAALGDGWVGWLGIRICGDDYDKDAIDHGPGIWDFEYCEIAYVDKRDGKAMHPWEDYEGCFYAHGASDTDLVFDDNWVHHGRSILLAYYGASNSTLMAEPVFRRNRFTQGSDEVCISVDHVYPSDAIRVNGEPTFLTTRFEGGSVSDYLHPESANLATVAYTWDTPVVLDRVAISGCGDREGAPWFIAINAP